MKQQPLSLRRASGLLLAAAALPFTPLAAQETQPPADPPAQTTPPPTQTAPVEAPPPATATPEPAETPAPTASRPTTETTPTRTAPAARTTRAPARPAPAPRATAPRAAPVRTVAPPPVAAPLAAPDSAPIAAAPAEPPATVPPTATPDVLPETPPATAADVVPAQEPQNGGSILPWLIGALLLGAAAFFLLRRRRRATEVYDEVYEERAAPIEPPVAHVEPIPVAPIVAAPVAAAPIAAAAVETGSPSIELLVRPLRAGVTGDDAVVEFELIVGNNGTAPARDVRISTWMFAAGTSGESEMERALIERPSEASLPEVTIDAGDGRRIESTVQLATAGLSGDAVLPVVVADARYRLPDGSEGHTSASFAVGVPDGAELAHFATENPSGLHEGVEARQVNEPQGA
jgi:hypothetical protein